MLMKVKVWIESNGQVIYGDGRHQLLKAVSEAGSLAGAARELGMSYRAAWGRLRASEDRLGYPLVAGGQKGRSGLKLTPEALKLMRRFDQMQKHLDDLIAKESQQWPSDLEPHEAPDSGSEQGS